ncbi:hypothetical protein JF634_00975 [Simonsiella muelleri]|uniref:Uncharacterized protein n=1 Tax=Simonsiella muelleri ATCC 29453 TaxID=641147 RepID=V9H690_9NEIS|nr:hypothetical protein [Simonsiella muelleri]AUX62021.1 hypothetical protein BWP33_09575 [Simonsiella muelleri ATCC 29453]EFG31470.1 hypothetical protein HMPREF9021_00740 [Simonsiella muelleri ATCC 29453]UBQ54119.1 hypothetical protein JF634_00975 [Simonsiella muelleri]
MEWHVLFPAGIIFAMAGGVIGVLGATELGHSSIRRVVGEVLISAIFAAAVAEYRLPLEKVWLCGGAGVIVGLITGYALDAVKAIAPNLINTALSGGFIRKILLQMLDKK